MDSSQVENLPGPSWSPSQRLPSQSDFSGVSVEPLGGAEGEALVFPLEVMSQ